jgi:hypothetical protein
MMTMPEVHAWFVDDPIPDGDPLAHVKQRAAAIWAAAEVLEQAARSGTVAARAGRIDPAAAVTADEAFTPDEVRDMWRASGLDQDELDAAANVAFELWTIEELRRLASIPGEGREGVFPGCWWLPCPCSGW